MRLLLDTHVLLWLAEGSDELAEASRDRIDRAATSSVGLAVCSISFWEVAMLARRGRITLAMPLEAWRRQVISARGMAEIAVDGEIAVESVELPGPLHADPADRMIVATARVHGCELATRDRRLLDYGAAGHVRVVRM